MLDTLLTEHTDAAAMFEGTLPDDERAVLVRAYRSIRGACLACAADDTGEAVAAVRAACETITDLAHAIVAVRSDGIMLRDRMTRLEEEHRTLSATAIQTMEDCSRAIAAERANTERTLTQERATQETRQRLAATTQHDFDLRARMPLERVATETSTILDDVTAVHGILDALAHREVTRIEELEIITVTEHGTAVERSLMDELSALGTEVSPYRARKRYDLAPQDLAVLRTLKRRYERLLENFAALAALIEDFRGSVQAPAPRSLAAAEQRLAACRRRILDADQLYRAMRLVLPELFTNADPLRLVGSSADALDSKHRAITELRSECDRLLMEARRRLGILEQRYSTYAKMLEERRSDIEELLDVNEMAWFEALVEDDQRIIRSAVLAVAAVRHASAEDKKKAPRLVTCKLLCEVLQVAGILDDQDAAEDMLYALLRPEFFAPGHGNADMQRKLRAVRLTIDGEYWCERWQREHTELSEQLRTAVTRREEILAAAEARRQHAREERERDRRLRKDEEAREAAARADAEAHNRAMALHPANIVGELSSDAQHLLVVIIDLLAMRAAEQPSPSHLVKWAAAAAVVGVVADTKPTIIIRELAALLAHDPPLLGRRRNGVGSTVILTELAQRVQTLLPTIPRERLDSVRQLAQTKTRTWSAHWGSKAERTYETFRSCHEQHGRHITIRDLDHGAAS